ncbi:unnamed protein product [Trichobilharzia szidati]|nr:unnamed protein product [Trichobilharzia szidati]
MRKMDRKGIIRGYPRKIWICMCMYSFMAFRFFRDIPANQDNIKEKIAYQRGALETFYDTKNNFNTTVKEKNILVYGVHFPSTGMDFSVCHASKCKVTTDRTKWREADVIILTDEQYPKGLRRRNQLWFTLVHESPAHIKIADDLGDRVNFTISYRLDSSVLSPYGLYQPSVKSDGPHTKYPLPERDFAKGKSKLVAWFVSNCLPNSPRTIYAHELSRHIEVDIYGECGSKKCPRLSEESCFKILREKYKFYLSFENSLCKYYVTEKFYRNALQNDIIPIVMGASIEEYQALAPPHSFIHVDQFESPKELAEYLRYLDRNNTAYNEYFAWRGHGEVSNWHGEPQCEICLLAHTIQHVKPHWVSDVSVWWNDACKNRNLRWKPSIL